MIFVVVMATLACASTAAADSLVYVGSDGNVWLANPDGGAQHQVTADGTPSTPYESPSQTDDGIVVAARGWGFNARLYRMRQNGELLNEPVPTPVVPFGPKVSPDGSLVAYYTIAAVSYPDCFYCVGTYDQALYSRPDTLTPYESIPMPHCCQDPSWMGSSGVLLTNGSATAWYSTVDQATSKPWFADGQATGSPSDEGLNDAELSPGGDRIAAVRSTYPVSTIGLYQANGPPPVAPTIRCEISGAAAREGLDYTSPTWSPDGRALAWEEQGGIMVLSLPSLDDCGGGGQARLVFPGAKDPDWSPAANAPPSRAAPPLGTSVGGGGNAETGGGGTGANTGGGGNENAGRSGAPKLSVTVARQRLGAVLRHGLALTVRCTQPCSVSGRLEVSRRVARRLRLGVRAVVVAQGRARLKRAGRVTLKLRVTRRAKTRVRRARSLTAMLKVQAKGASGATRTVRRAVRLGR